MCGNSGGPTQVVSLSTATGYTTSSIVLTGKVSGNKLVIGILVINITSSATLTVTVQISYDGGQTWKDSSNTTATAVGPKELSITGMDAALFRVNMALTGTTQWCLASVTPNYSCQ